MIPGAKVLATAMTAIGKPYVFGTAGPRTFDCSGLMQWAYSANGIKLPRVTYDQVKVGQAVNKGAWQIGDLLFSSWDGKPHSHVGMYAGNNQILVAPSSGKNVQLQTLGPTYLSRIDAVRRVPGVEGYTGPTGQPSNGGGIIPGLPDPGDLPGAISSGAGALRDIASGLRGAGALAEKALWLTLPSSWTRIISGVLGLAFLFLGIATLMRQALKT